LHALLVGHKDLELISAINQQKEKLPIDAVTNSLLYLRNRIGVPRDMSVHGAKQMRSYINWYIDQLK